MRSRIYALAALLAAALAAVAGPAKATVFVAYDPGTKVFTITTDANDDVYIYSALGGVFVVNDVTFGGGTGPGGLFSLDDVSGGVFVIGDAGNNPNVFLVDDSIEPLVLSGGAPLPITLNGGGGDDLLLGASGPQTLIGGDGDDVLLGGGDNDLLDGGAGDNLLDGERGNDTQIADGFNNLLLGSPGDDLFDLRSGAVLLDAEDGNDTITFANANNGVTLAMDDIGTLQALSVDLSLQLESPTENFVGSGFDDVLSLLPQSFNRVADGGAGSDALNYDPQPATASDDGFTISTPGFGDIAYINFETVNINGPASVTGWMLYQ